MGAIARSAANLVTTSGVWLKAGVNNDSFDNVTAFSSGIPADSITLISSQTASSSATISFTTGIDSTYKAYKFVFVNIRPATDSVNFQFNMSTDSGSNYNVTKTTTLFFAFHDEADTSANISYDAASLDLAQQTTFQTIMRGLGNGADECGSGSLTLFNPSSTTYVKHFISNINRLFGDGDYSGNEFVAGYGNTTSAINALRFQMSSGNIADGKIYLYGIK